MVDFFETLVSKFYKPSRGVAMFNGVRLTNHGYGFRITAVLTALAFALSMVPAHGEELSSTSTDVIPESNSISATERIEQR